MNGLHYPTGLSQSALERQRRWHLRGTRRLVRAELALAVRLDAPRPDLLRALTALAAHTLRRRHGR